MRAVWMVVFLAACGGDDGPGGGGGPFEPELKPNLGVDLANVSGFVIAPVTFQNSAASFAEEVIDQLFTLNADGSLTIVTVVTTVDGDGTHSNTTTQRARPRHVFDSPKYLLIAYDNVRYQGQECFSVAVRKADAALFCVPLIVHPPDLQGQYSPTVAADASGDVLTVDAFERLVTLDFSAAAGPTQTVIADTMSDGFVRATVTNPDGDIAVELSPNAQGSNTRVYRKSGGFMSFGMNGDCLTTGVGADATSFYVTRRESGGIWFELFKLTKTGTMFAETKIYSDTNRAVDIPSCQLGGSMARSASSIYVPSDGQGQGPRNFFVELVNPTGQPVRHDVPAMTTVDSLYGYDAGLVVLGADGNGNSILQRWSAGAFTTVLDAGEYVITSLSVTPSGEITFGGRRAADNARIVGTVAAGSTEVTIVPQMFAGDVVQIQRIQ